MLSVPLTSEQPAHDVNDSLAEVMYVPQLLWKTRLQEEGTEAEDSWTPHRRWCCSWKFTSPGS